MKSKQNTKRPCGARQSRENSKPSQHIKISNVSTSFRLGFDNVDYVFKDCLHIKVTEASHTVCLLTRCSAQGTIAFGTHSFLLQAWQGNISICRHGRGRICADFGAEREPYYLWTPQDLQDKENSFQSAYTYKSRTGPVLIFRLWKLFRMFFLSSQWRFSSI